MTSGGVLRGAPAASGFASGPVVRHHAPLAPPEHEPPSEDPDADAARQRAALEAVATDLLDRAARAGGTAADVLTAEALMARDPGLAEAAERHLREGRGVTHALLAAVDEYCDTLAAAGGHMAERVADLRAVGDAALAVLLGVAQPGLPAMAGPSILVAEDLAPADAAVLDPAVVVGIVLHRGGPTSHTAVLATQLGIPTVVRVEGAMEVPDGTPVVIDGGRGIVHVAPDAARRADLDARRAAWAAAVARAGARGVLADGQAVPIRANVGSAQEACAVAATDVEGVGLFRTEMLYLNRMSPPTRQEQEAVYAQVFAAWGARPVIVRTLDVGADKPLGFANLGAEENPALGRRGIRHARAFPELLDDQLAAMAAAARAHDAEVAVMAPMVATADEARWFARRARAAGFGRVGVMIEVPAAALRAPDILAEVDFASVGTNDLAQYAMAADRLNGDLAPLLDPWQPALLDLVALTCAAGAARGVPVGVCGEAAGDPLLALVLAGLGIHSLSAGASRRRLVRASLASHTRAQCERIAAAARAATSPQDARDAALALADPLVADLL